MAMLAGMTRAPHVPLRAQLVHQLFFQYAPRLNEQAAVDGLVRHAHALVVGTASFQPSGNLLGRPVQHQFTRNDIAQLAVHGKQTTFRPQCQNPSLPICIMRTVGWAAAMASDLPTYGGGSSIEMTRYLTNRRAGSDPSRDVFSLSQSECQPRAAASNRRDAAARQQHSTNRVMRLTVEAPNLMQRLSRLPTAPDVTLLDRRKPKPRP